MTAGPGLPLFACDLDRTLIYSLEAAGLGTGGGLVDPSTLHCVELLDDEPLSYVMPEVPALLRRLSDICRFLPVTTRTIRQYRRIDLFAGELAPEWAVCANGGHLLWWGRPDDGWHRSMGRILADTGVEPDDVAHRMAALGDWVARARVADELFVYAVVDLERADSAAIDHLGEWLDGQGWQLSRQGRKIYAAPVGVEKWAAVDEVRDRTGATRVGAAGDSILDRVMLDRANFSVRPPHGELEVVGHRADLVLPVAGVEAGAAVLAAAIAWAGRTETDGA